MNCTANACTTADAGDDAGRFALTTTAPCCRVTEYGLMRVSGKDAVTFLHGQFTNAVTGLADEVRNAGYCTPKGRLLATFRVWMDGDDVMMLVPKAVAPAFFKRLRMYVLRADVTFTCTGGDVVMTGVPAGAEAFLEAAGLPVPASSRVVRHDGLVIVDAEPASKVEGFCAGGRRALIIAPKDDARFADASTDSALWWASEIAAGKTTVWPGSRELFVPQAVNYELSGGVVFNKGCYPGQEVVSRVQHTGWVDEPPRRLRPRGRHRGPAPRRSRILRRRRSRLRDAGRRGRNLDPRRLLVSALRPHGPPHAHARRRADLDPAAALQDPVRSLIALIRIRPAAVIPLW